MDERHLLVAVPWGAGRRASSSSPGPNSEQQKQLIRAEGNGITTIYLARLSFSTVGSGGWCRLDDVHARSEELTRTKSGQARAVLKGTGPQPATRSGVLESGVELVSTSTAWKSALMRPGQAVLGILARHAVAVIRIAFVNYSICQMRCGQKRNLEHLIRRAEIEDSIEVHLCLAPRESKAGRAGGGLHDVRAMVANRIRKSRTRSTANLVCQLTEPTQNFSTVRPMLKVVLRNLIQNAVSYSGQSIHVAIDADGFVIRNSSDMTDAQVSEEEARPQDCTTRLRSHGVGLLCPSARQGVRRSSCCSPMARRK